MCLPPILLEIFCLRKQVLGPCGAEEGRAGKREVGKGEISTNREEPSASGRKTLLQAGELTCVLTSFQSSPLSRLQVLQVLQLKSVHWNLHEATLPRILQERKN